jgi:hypothetical protein
MSVERREMELETTTEEQDSPMAMAIVSASVRAELDQQIVTARANPRSIKRFVNECLDLACLSEEVASECYFVLPRGGKNIEGPAVRLAEIVQYAWGNSQSGSQVIDEGEEFVTAQGVFYDLERNNRVTAVVKRRILDSHGRRYNIDMIGVTGQAACSVARRNAIFQGVPKALWNPIYLAARKLAAGDIKSLVTNRTEALNYLARRGVTQETVIAALGVGGIEDIGLDELATIRGMITAIKDEGVSIETAFAPKEPAASLGKPKTETPKAKTSAKATDPDAFRVEREPGSDDEPPPPAGKRVSARTQDSRPIISTQQRLKLIAKANAESVEMADLLTHFNVESLDDMPQYQFAAAYTWLGTAITS